MKRVISLLLAVALLCTVFPHFILGANAAEAQSASFISRSDGVWLWPTTYYAVSDWAGCNASPSVNSYCYFCGVQHGICGADHLTTLGHNGVDIPVGVGSEVYAAAPGTLYCTNYDWPSRGITAVVEHPITGTGWSYYSIYQHLQSTVIAKNGASVVAGEVIAWSGNTNGYGTGQAHLHFGIVMGTSGQGNSLAQAPNANISAIENCGWITSSGYATGRILPNPALNSPAGNPIYTDGCESNVRAHAGSVMYTGNASEVSIGESIAECNHSYTSVEIPASCTENGVYKYTCTSCGDTYSETIEALGHNYIGVKTDATCITAGYTTYTCSRCGDSYVENADSWSEWSTEYPTGIPENLIEQKTQYSTLEKEYTTSTSDSLDGWISCGTTYGDWGAVQTTTSKPTESDTLRITNTVQTGWGYHHWCNYYYNGGNNWNVDSIEYGSPCYWHDYISSFELPAVSFPDKGGQQAYGGTGSGASPCVYNFYVWFRNPDADVYTYSYQTRSEYNQFYRWAEGWSEWSDDEAASSEDCKVKTQTVYRYYVGELSEHNYSDANGFCTVCGAADPDYSTVTVPTITASTISLSFEDEILLNVYFTATDAADVVSYGLLTFSEKVDNPTYDTAIASTLGWHESNGYLGVTTPGIAAKNMGDKIYFAVYAVLSDGSYAYSKCYSYAPTTYAYSMLSKSTTTDGMKSLIVAMLNYGAAAQEYFGYNTEKLVNASLTDEQKALVVDYNADMLNALTYCDAAKKGDLFGNGNTGFNTRTPSVNFEGAFSVNFYFANPKATVGSDVTFYVWDKATYNSVDTLLPTNATATSKCTFDGTYYAGIVEGIAAKEVDETFYCAAVFTGEDGNTYVSGVIAYSLGYYLENQATGTKMPEFAQATGVYAYYAKTLFN